MISILSTPISWWCIAAYHIPTICKEILIICILCRVVFTSPSATKLCWIVPYHCSEMADLFSFNSLSSGSKVVVNDFFIPSCRGWSVVIDQVSILWTPIPGKVFTLDWVWPFFVGGVLHLLMNRSHLASIVICLSSELCIEYQIINTMICSVFIVLFEVCLIEGICCVSIEFIACVAVRCDVLSVYIVTAVIVSTVIITAIIIFAITIIATACKITLFLCLWIS